MKKLLLFLAVLGFQIGFSQQKNDVKIVESKKTELTSELSKDQIELYNKTFLKFVAALKASDKQTINALISDKVKALVTDNMIQKLSSGISFDKKTEVYKTGYQTLLDNATYPSIQYKYAGDSSVPPRDIITVVFENDGKILGVKPDFSK